MEKELKVGDKFHHHLGGKVHKFVVGYVGKTQISFTQVNDNNDLICTFSVDKCLLDQNYKPGWPIELVHGGIYQLNNEEEVVAVMMPTWKLFAMFNKTGDMFHCRCDKYGVAEDCDNQDDYSVKQQLPYWFT